MRLHITTALAPVLLALMLSQTAIAQTAVTENTGLATTVPVVSVSGAGQVTSYKPDYFTEFQVSTARDMVFHIPGFTFQQGEQVRGFAGAAGNVLIDGQRPASKNTLNMTLNNISAAQVDHIELIVGGAPGIDMQGYSQIVNVVRKQSDKPSIFFGGNVKFFREDSKPAGFFNYSSNKGGKTTNFYVEAFEFKDNGVSDTKRYIYTPDLSDPMPKYVFIPQVGRGTGHAEKFDHSRPFLGGKLSFNANYNPIYYDLNADYIRDGVSSPEHMDLKETESEIGLQYERKLTKTVSLDLNMLRRYDRESIEDIYRETDYSALYKSLAQSSEHIFSGKLTWQPNDTLTYKVGAENVVNRRDNATSYVENNLVTAVPFDTVRVEEDRNEYYIIRNWQATPSLNVETGLKVETSTISVKQEDRSQSFVYPKPKVQIVWTANKDLKVTWRTERVVGQLNFDDFASSVSLDTAVIQAGNPEIVPQKEWQNSLAFDYSFWSKGAIKFQLLYSALQDTLDYKPIVTSDGVFNARGNIGDGTFAQAGVWVTLPLDKLYIKGGELKFDYEVNHTRVTDPITGKDRRISRTNPNNYNISFNQNLTKYRASWGVEIASQNDKYQYNATDAYTYRSSPWVSVFAEYKTKTNLTYAIVIQNPAGRYDKYDRTVYEGQRATTPVSRVERNSAYSKPWFILKLKKEL
ncbi:hypothetical protein AEAC466_11580 [Asticcacaulis sp. AC466]|uniref:TonB-dependent receptor plug domain-containing protein n=1 Tax=Asticcacaulis sp. AC466 TaxID=1282362 RepID=UPI0003C3C674|nr:TonB-dependent receptor plug domain-containing protein [Asticcacaulis sp. AC466]ESQ83801.1 hypothetical protein AEAC466_11580 [Asticcacaulis sp. AC466]